MGCGPCPYGRVLWEPFCLVAPCTRVRVPGVAPLPHSTAVDGGVAHGRERIFQACATNQNPHSTFVWVDRSLEYGTSLDPFSRIHSTDEGIIQSMKIGEELWGNYHHRSNLPDDNEDY